MVNPKILELRSSFASFKEQSQSDKATKSTKEGKRKRKKKKSKLLKKHVTLKVDEHTISLEELCDRLNTNPETGLTEEQAKEHVAKFGKNILSPPAESHPLSRYFVHNVQGLAGIAWTGVSVCFLTYLVESFANTVREPDIELVYLGLSMTFFVMVNGTVSYFIEWRAKRLLRALKSKISHFTVVIRNGERKTINAQDVAVGDLIEIRAGDRVPADIRVTKSSNFKVDNSSLTGQSEPAKIQPGITNANPLLTTNLIFLSTFALEGTCQGIVFNIGNKTVVGHIKRHKSTLKQVQTMLTKSIIRIILVYTIIGMWFSLSFCILYMRAQLSSLQIALIFVAVYVACVPEQILLALLVILTVTGKRMQRHNCLPKHFHAIETLGSISYILTDKTGILTDTIFTVSHVWVGQGVLGITEEAFLKLEHSTGFKALLRCAMLCGKPELWDFENDDVPELRKLESWTKTRALQLALIRFVKENVLQKDFSDLVNTTAVHESLFNSTKKYYLSVNSLKDHSRQLVVIMGSPEAVFRHCYFIIIGEKKKPITEKIRAEFNLAFEKMASHGESVFAFADMFLEVDYNEQMHVHRHSFRFLGLISLKNPIRASIPDAVAKCRSASIRVIMISRDHPSTTKAIAIGAGIITDKSNALVISGELLSAVSPDQLDRVIKENDEVVFANTTPIHKFQIVESCQRLGGRVAVTGIDVRDCQAMKAAEIGVAPSSGSDILKQAADLILLDDSFATIVTGIEAGRLIYENLQKCLLYTIASVVPQLGPFLLYMILRIPRPLGAFSILLITISTELLPVLALPYEEAEFDLMKAPPRDVFHETLLDAQIFRRAYLQIGVLQLLAGMFAYLIVLIDNGFHPNMLIKLSTRWDNPNELGIKDFYGQEWNYFQRKELEFTCHSAFFFAVIMTQIANLIACRTKTHSIFHQGKKNWALFGVILSMFVIGIFCSSLPSGHLEEAVKHRQLYWFWFLPSLPFVLLIFAMEEFRRYMSRRHHNGWAGLKCYF